MAIHYDKLVNWDIPEVRQRLTKRDTILYALGVGLGADPCDEHQLRFVYEENLLALPTMAIILGYPGPWHAHPDTGITRSHVVHGEQGFRILGTLPKNVKPVIQRFKGLGEMNADQLKVTTLDPKKRRALRVVIDEELETDRVLNELMGRDASQRFRFIMERAAKADSEALDV